MKRVAIVLFTALLATSGAACTKKSAEESLATATTLGSATTAMVDDVEDAEDSPATTSKPRDDEGNSDKTTDTTVAKDESYSDDGGCPTAAEAAEVKGFFEGVDLLTPGADTTKLIEGLKKALALMEKYIPSSLNDEFEVMKAALTEFYELYSQVDLSNPASISPELRAQFEALMAKVESPEVQQAGDSISNYFKTHCDSIDLGLDE